MEMKQSFDEGPFSASIINICNKKIKSNGLRHCQRRMSGVAIKLLKMGPHFLVKLKVKKTIIRQAEEIL